MILAITGQMRSGTSAIACAVHRAGIPVCVTMPAPLPPAWNSDYEDFTLSAALLEGKCDEAWFKEYFAYRRAHADLAFGHEHFAIKSPWLAFCALELNDLFDDITWVKTSRDQAGIDASMSHHKQLNPDINKSIAQLLDNIPGVTIDYNTLLADPRLILRILPALGIPYDVDAITATIRRED
jgi:hypothetical protein